MNVSDQRTNGASVERHYPGPFLCQYSLAARQIMGGPMWGRLAHPRVAAGARRQRQPVRVAERPARVAHARDGLEGDGVLGVLDRRAR